MTDFWEPLNPGWFIIWGLEIERYKYPNARISACLESGQAICGSVPNEPDGQTIQLQVDSQQFGRRYANF